jgi:hypothetical protein
MSLKSGRKYGEAARRLRAMRRRATVRKKIQTGKEDRRRELGKKVMGTRY